MRFEDLTEEQRAKAEGCKTVEELFDFIKEEGIELGEEELEKVAGGGDWDLTYNYANCRSCGKRVEWPPSRPDPKFCPYCGCVW